MSDKPRFIFLDSTAEQASEISSQLEKNYELVVPETLESGLQEIRSEQVKGLFFAVTDQSLSEKYLQLTDVLEHLPDGLVILDPTLKILWTNDQLSELVKSEEPLAGKNFYQVLLSIQSCSGCID